MVWSYSTQRNIDRIIKLQKRCIRIITYSEFAEHTGPPCSELKLLKAKDIFSLTKLLFSKPKAPSLNICLKETDSLFFCSLFIANNFEEAFSDLAQNVIEKLSAGPKNFDVNSVREFSKMLILEENTFLFTKVSEKIISGFLNKLGANKAIGIYSLSDTSLKGESKVLSTSIAQI